MVVATRDEHARALRQLLPPGWILPEGLESNLGSVLRGLSVELERLSERNCQLVEEADPRTTVEMVGDWERVLGLPNDCGPIQDTLEGRRANILARLLIQDGATVENLEAIAAAWGERVKITQRQPIQFGFWQFGEGHEFGPPETRFLITIDFGVRPVVHLQCGVSHWGDRFTDFEQPSWTICALRDAAPAHVDLEFVFTAEAVQTVGRLPIERTPGVFWHIDRDGDCISIAGGAADGVDILVVSGGLPLELADGSNLPLTLNPVGGAWTLEVARGSGGGVYQVHVDPARLALEGGAEQTHCAPIDENNCMQVILSNGTELAVKLEEQPIG